MISNLGLAREYLRSVNAPFGLNQQLVVKGFARWLDERRSSVETPAEREGPRHIHVSGICAPGCPACAAVKTNCSGDADAS